MDCSAARARIWSLCPTATSIRAISVFAGAFDLEGAAAVFVDTPFEVLGLLASLSAKSLLVLEP